MDHMAIWWSLERRWSGLAGVHGAPAGLGASEAVEERRSSESVFRDSTSRSPKIECKHKVKSKRGQEKESSTSRKRNGLERARLFLWLIYPCSPAELRPHLRIVTVTQRARNSAVSLITKTLKCYHAYIGNLGHTQHPSQSMLLSWVNLEALETVCGSYAGSAVPEGGEARAGSSRA